MTKERNKELRSSLGVASNYKPKSRNASKTPNTRS